MTIFQKAQDADPTNPMIYLQRGQVSSKTLVEMGGGGATGAAGTTSFLIPHI